jgi:ribosome-associated translation inhibitor RaiA
METNLQVDFQGEVSIHGIREKIAEQVAKLEKHFGRIMACRVVVKRPSDHHRIGPYEINIRLALPQGKEVNVARTPDADERHSDFGFAVQDAFKRARRQLQDHARRLQGQVIRPRGRSRT